MRHSWSHREASANVLLAAPPEAGGERFKSQGGRARYTTQLTRVRTGSVQSWAATPEVEGERSEREGTGEVRERRAAELEHVPEVPTGSEGVAVARALGMAPEAGAT